MLLLTTKKVVQALENCLAKLLRTTTDTFFDVKPTTDHTPGQLTFVITIYRRGFTDEEWARLHTRLCLDKESGSFIEKTAEESPIRLAVGKEGVFEECPEEDPRPYLHRDEEAQGPYEVYFVEEK